MAAITATLAVSIKISGKSKPANARTFDMGTALKYPDTEGKGPASGTARADSFGTVVARGTANTLAIQMDARAAMVLYEKVGNLGRSLGWLPQK